MKRNQRNFSGVASELHEKLKLEGSKLKAQRPKGRRISGFFGADVVLEVTFVRFFSCA